MNKSSMLMSLLETEIAMDEPSNIVRSFAVKYGKPQAEVERLWDKAKSIAAEAGHTEDYPYIVGILKNMMGE